MICIGKEYRMRVLDADTSVEHVFVSDDIDELMKKLQELKAAGYTEASFSILY